MAIDPMIGKRNWSNVMEEIIKFKNGSTLQRWKTAIKDKAFDSIRALPLLETQAALFYRTKGEPLNIVIPCRFAHYPFLSLSVLRCARSRALRNASMADSVPDALGGNGFDLIV
jgi:hypothetical protein